MSSLPPVADPTATMPPSVTSTAPVVSGIVVATPSSTTTTAPTTVVTTTVAPPPPAITVERTAPVLTTVPVLSAQAPVYVPVPVTAHVTTSSAVVKQLPVVATTLVATTSKSSSSSSKGNKKKAASAAAAAALAAATVTMATAATAQSSGANGGAQGENTGRWTSEEHNLFLQGLELHGKGWKKIAGLIKSRTVVQIRTHAQKYFQKLAKAKQNGEDVGGSNAGVGNAISMMMMEGRSNGGGSIQVSNGHNGNNIPSSSTSGSGYGSVHTNKRRKQTTGTKRKAIQSVVASARREVNKKLATTASTQYDYPVGVAPALAPYILPFDVTSSNTIQQSGTGIQAQGTPLEDSLFRYLTPTSIHPPETQVNPVALQAGANPITLPTSKTANTLAGGEISPTGVSDFELYPSWTDFSKGAPSWYAKGSDVDALLDVADSLDWLTDTGDLTEVYEEAERMDAVNNTTVDPSQAPMQKEMMVPVGGGTHYDSSNNIASSMSTNTLPRIDSGAQVVCVPPLPSLFCDGVDGSDDPDSHKERGIMSSAPSVAILDEHLFSSPIEESDFVSCIMNDTNSSATLSALALDTSS